MGLAGLGRVKKRRDRRFAIGLVAFAAFGYIETLYGYMETLFEAIGAAGISRVELASTESDLVISSIPYVLYGLFLIFHFATLDSPKLVTGEGIPAVFVERYRLSPAVYIQRSIAGSGR